MKIFIDFDDTLFNTKKFRDCLIKVFLDNGVKRKDFFATYYDYPVKTSHGLKKYDPDKQIEILTKNSKIKREILESDFKKLISHSSQYLFQDTLPFLRSFRKKDLILISFAITKFQCSKINCSRTPKYLSKVIVSDRDKAREVEKIVSNANEEIFFIDDRVENINAVKKLFPVSITFLLKRKEGRYNDKKTKFVDFEIKNLKEAKKIIKNKIEKQRS